MLELIDKSCFDEVYEIMRRSFPENERRTKESQRTLFDDKAYKVAGVRGADGRLNAFMAMWKLDGLTFLEHFAVAENLRGAGLGGAFLDELLSGLGGLVCLEVEPEETTDMAARRIAFYGRHGFILNDYPYIQPPLGEDRAAQPLKVMSYGAALTKEEFESMRSQVYKAVYKADTDKYL